MVAGALTAGAYENEGNGNNHGNEGFSLPVKNKESFTCNILTTFSNMACS